jgi:uncharacterized membrane protein
MTAWWKIMADRNGYPRVVAFAQRQVTLTDFAFTATGAVLIAVGGIGSARVYHMDLVHTAWLYWGEGLFMVSGLIWVFILIPVQYLQGKLARKFESEGTIPEEYWKLNRIWAVFGMIATLLPLINLYLMVCKPH